MDKLQPSIQQNFGVINNEVVVENQGCSNSPMIRLGNDSPIWSNNEATRNMTTAGLHDDVNCDDLVDENGFEGKSKKGKT